MVEEIAGFFKNGFHLANKNLDLYFTNLVLTVVAFSLQTIGAELQQHQSNPLLLLGLGLLSIAVFLYLESFDLTKIGIIATRQKGQEMSLSQILRVTLVNLKRLIFPFALLLLLVIAIFILIGAFAFGIFHLPMPSNPPDPGALAIIFTAVIFVLSTLLSYTQVFFSIEGKGFFSSLKDSLIYALRNIPFTVSLLLITLVSLLMNSLGETGLVPGTPWFVLHLAIVSIPTFYIDLITISAILLYYEKSKTGTKLVKQKKH